MTKKGVSFFVACLMMCVQLPSAKSEDVFTLGDTYYGLGLFKSTNIGSFERYLAPELSKFTKFNWAYEDKDNFSIAYTPVTADRNFDPMNEIFNINNLPFQNSKSLLFPDGGNHNKFSYKISLNPGYTVSVNQEFYLKTPIYSHVHRLGFSCFYDVNKVKLDFQNGLGILTDPTSASGKNIFQGCGPHIGIGINAFKLFSKHETVFVKLHLIHYNTHSSAKIFSDFLNLREREFQKNNVSMVSIDYIIPIFHKNGVNLVLSTYAFQSKYMWTAATSVGFEKKY
jgi:hypothetical protein